jgi:transcriptional regulator with XRE-family HTH domain
MISPAQIRAARVLLRWKQTDLAAATGLSETEIKKLEHGRTNPRRSTLDRLQKAFDAAGMMFLEAAIWAMAARDCGLKNRE